jgi:prepilin-type N-terminal cleavage/methylation domain-containing protein
MIRTRLDGFSLVELMIVVGLIAVLAGVAAPQVAAGMRQYSLISATQEVASTIRAARYQAVGKNLTLRVRFNFPAANQYQVVTAAGVAVGDVRLLPTGATFFAVSDIVQINTSGRVTGVGGPAPVTIVVSNGDNTKNRTITVTASGRVQLP